jgi:MSHA biogenesis protein MshL
MKRAKIAVVLLALAGCITPPAPEGLDPAVKAEVDATAKRKREAPPAAVDESLLPPLRMEMPDVRGQAIDPKFDLSVQNAPAAQVFSSLVAGTRYSMLLHPGVSGNITLNLKDVSLREALDAIRELYGYEYRIEGTRIFVQAAGLQTRVFHVNYLPGQRRGLSDVRVQSGAISESGAAPGTPGAPAPGAAPASRSLESAHVRTEQHADFWSELRTALIALVGVGEGRSVVVTPQSGVVVIRAMPTELRAVENYLRATRLAVERQVMLEAKIVEVTLSDAYQAGINWATFRSNLAGGQLAPGTTLGAKPQPLAAGNLTADVASRNLTAAAGAASAAATGAVFGLALQTSNFAALLTFLESQGNVQVLSSPRIATLNSQKAVLKVGTDEFFVTNVSTTTTSTGATSQQSPSVTVQPFFSGIVLDVTPQIDVGGNIILHIHPSVSEVTESTRVVNLGGEILEIRLPLAKSAVSETDTIVRVTDGNIVAIGGLMTVDIRDERGGIPGVSDSGLGRILRNTNRTARKKELVILLKPTVIQSDREWGEDLRETRGRFQSLERPARR